MRNNHKILLGVVGFVWTAVVNADVVNREVVDGVEWAFSVQSGHVTIGRDSYSGIVIGDIMLRESAVSQTTSGNVLVPSSLGGFPVTKIEECAFAFCSNIVSVTIPEGIETIGKCTFVGCSRLQRVDVVSKNPNFASQDGVLFNKSKNTLIACPGAKKGSYSIPKTVNELAACSFYACEGLRQVTIPKKCCFD